MNILLINPPPVDNIVADLSDYFDESGGAYPPLGLMYLASSLSRDSRHKVRILDANLMKLDYSGIRERVKACMPDVVGITTLTFNVPAVLQIAHDIKEINKQIVTVLGGPHVSIFPDETLAFPQVDFIVIGEGEIVFQQLVSALEAGMSVDGIAGIGFKRAGEPVINRETHFIENLDDLPFPAIDLVDYREYFSVLSPGKQTMVMMSSRGCPFKCIYCDRPHLGRKFRARSPANVVDEMEMCVVKYGINDIKFFDDTFTVNRQRVLDICGEIRRRGLGVTWGARARVNTVDHELLKTMKEAGLTSISFGIESGSQKILDILQKGITIAQVEDAAKACRALGIEVLGDFIIGNPGEKREEVMETISLARRLELDYAQFTVMTPYPSTQLYAMGLKSGVLKSDYWREFARHPTREFVTPVWEEFYTKKHLVSALRKAYRSFYFRPTYVLMRLRKIKSPAEFRRKLAAFLALVRLNLLSWRRLVKNFKSRS